MFLVWSFLSLLVLKKALAGDPVCIPGTLQCDDGEECVSSQKWCDGTNDCKDKSDESYCKTSWWSDPNECKEREPQIHFICDGGKCLPQHALCNNFTDCKDESDEDYFTCTNSELATSTSAKAKEKDDSDYDENGGNNDDSKENSPEEDHPKQTITSTKISPASSTQATSSVRTINHWSTRDYYEGRIIQESSNGEIPLQPSTKSFAIQYTTSRRPQVRPSVSPVVVPSTQPSSVHVRHPNRHRGGVESRPVSHENNPRDYRSFGHAAAPDAYNPHLRTYDYRLSANDNLSTYDRRYSNNNKNFQQYGNRQHYEGRSGIYSQHPSIFPNRPQHRGDNRPHPDYERQHRESEWGEVATFKPYNRETQVNKPFYFANDLAARFGRKYEDNLKEAEKWLLGQRSKSGDWGSDTARALIALSLANNTFPSYNSDFEIMKRNFMVQLSVDLLRNSSASFSINRLATSMNALLAVCENPRDFHGMDLSELLRSRIREKVRKRAHLNPSLYLSLCLAGKNLSSSEIHHMLKQIQPTEPLNEIAKDTQIMAIQAFACYIQQQLRQEEHYRTSLQEQLNHAVQQLLQRMLDNGSFGSVYSTALATQALMSVNVTLEWNADKTLHFLQQQQAEDGSFGDLLATYFVMPVLAGRSLMHLRNIGCQRLAKARDLTPSEILDFVGPKHYLHYSIYFGYPLENSHSVRVLVPQGINFFDVMRVADYQDKDFRFVYEMKDKKVSVYSLSGVPNDAEQGFLWHLYVKQESDAHSRELNTRELYVGDLREFLPTANQHIIFWYHPVGLQVYSEQRG